MPGRRDAAHRERLYERRRQADARRHAATVAAVTATGDAAGARERVRLLRETAAGLERRVALERGAVAAAEVLAGETARLERELLEVRAQRIETAVSAAMQDDGEDVGVVGGNGAVEGDSIRDDSGLEVVDDVTSGGGVEDDAAGGGGGARWGGAGGGEERVGEAPVSWGGGGSGGDDDEDGDEEGRHGKVDDRPSDENSAEVEAWGPCGRRGGGGEGEWGDGHGQLHSENHANGKGFDVVALAWEGDAVRGRAIGAIGGGKALEERWSEGEESRVVGEEEAKEQTGLSKEQGGDEERGRENPWIKSLLPFL